MNVNIEFYNNANKRFQRKSGIHGSEEQRQLSAIKMKSFGNDHFGLHSSHLSHISHLETCLYILKLSSALVFRCLGVKKKDF